MRRFLIDTDTASDDAIALIMALQHPDIEVEAITVVAGNVELDQAVQNALYTVELCEKHTPVYVGRSGPLMQALETAEYVHGKDGLGDVGLPTHGRIPAAGRAVDVIVDTITNSPGEITLVALGPLSNVAAALVRAPEIAQQVERVVIMGGTGVHGPGNVTPMAEYNFWADPEAAAIVTASGMPLEFVGWDISIESAVVTDTRHDEIAALGTTRAEFTLAVMTTVRAFAKAAGHAGGDLPDPIAMAHAIDPSVAATAKLAVRVLPGEGPQRGAMEIDRLGASDTTPNVDIVTDYPSAAFFDLLLAALR